VLRVGLNISTQEVSWYPNPQFYPWTKSRQPRVDLNNKYLHQSTQHSDQNGGLQKSTVHPHEIALIKSTFSYSSKDKHFHHSWHYGNSVFSSACRKGRHPGRKKGGNRKGGKGVKRSCKVAVHQRNVDVYLQ